MNKDLAADLVYNNVNEMNSLILKSQQGDRVAQELLVKGNIGLVSTIVKKFTNRGFEYEDLFQIGCIGLIKAIKNFNSDFNVRFSTYAVPMIMGEIKRFIRDDGIIKVSRSLKETSKKIHSAKEKLTKDLGREVTLSEIASELCITTEEVIMSLESMHAPEYLYEIIHQDDGAPVLLIDKLSEAKDYGSEVLEKVALKELLSSLEPRARQIIIMRYFKDLTQTQISEKLGISQVQVSRIEKRVLEYLRKSLK